MLSLALGPVARPVSAQPVRDGTGNASGFGPVVEIQTGDYAKIRTDFRSVLTHKGPAPQKWSPVSPPEEAVEITYESAGLKLKGWLSRSKDHKNHPAVLFLHGGFSFGQSDWAMSQPFRTAGFVVLTPMLRGENGQPGSFSMFYNEVDDALAAAESLSRQPGVDTNRIYVAGHSAGGTIALLCAMASNRFRAVASFSGSPDQALFLQHVPPTTPPFDTGNAREVQVRSPLAYAASLKCPARLFYGAQEPHFQITSQKLASVAKQHGIDAVAIQVPGGHDSTPQASIAQTIQFFNNR